MPITVAFSSKRSINFILQSRRAWIDTTAERLFIEFVSLAQKSVDIAAYDIRSRAVLEALSALSKRVKVRILVDAGTKLRQGVPALDPKSGTTVAAVEGAGLGDHMQQLYVESDGAMHHKFAVRDNAAVWTGGMNFTDGGLHLEDAGAIILESEELAQVFTAEFERLRTGTKPDHKAHAEVKVGKGHKVTPLFGRRIKEAILQALAQPVKGRKRVRIMAYAISDQEIFDALTSATEDIQGIYDHHGMDDRFLEDPRFVAAPSNQFHCYGEPNALAQKLLIVDDTVFFGSYNFSNAFDTVDDNMLSIQSPQVLTNATRYFDLLATRYRTYAEEAVG